MTAPWLLWLNAHKDTCNPLQTWDTLHLQRALLSDPTMAQMCWLHEPLIPPDAPSERPSLVLISGAHHASRDDYAHLRGVLADVPDPVVVLHSDEESLFDWTQIDRPDVRWWVTTPRQSVHGPLVERGARFFGEGPGPTPEGGWPTSQTKPIDVSFRGQNTHARRHECVQALRDLRSTRHDLRVEVTPTDGFMKGAPRDAYLLDLALSKVVACPSGPGTSDSFRLYEAIECGAVPVLERRTPDGIDHGTFEMMWPDDSRIPAPFLDDWNDLHYVVDDLLTDDRWVQVAADCQRWWSDRKADLRSWLRADLGLP